MIDANRKKPFPALSMLTFLFALTFEMMVCCFLDGIGPVKLLYSLIALLCLLTVAVWKLKISLYAPTSPIQSLGRTVLMITAVSTSGLFIAFYFLLSLKVDEVALKDSSYVVVFIPIYTFLFISAFFICFIFPGLVDPSIRAYREACLLLAYYVSVIVCIIMTINELDAYAAEQRTRKEGEGQKKNLENFTRVFVPLWIIFSLHFMSIMAAILRKADSLPNRHFHPAMVESYKPQFPAQELCFLLLIGTQVLLLNLKFIDAFPLSSWILLSPTFLLTLYVSALLQVSTMLAPRTKKDSNMSGFDPDDIFLEEGNTRDDLQSEECLFGFSPPLLW